MTLHPQWLCCVLLILPHSIEDWEKNQWKYKINSTGKSIELNVSTGGWMATRK